MSIKKMYYYLFYKLYKFSEAAPSRWWSDWKAGLAIDTLIFFFFLSLGLYYKIFINANFDFGSDKLFVLFFILIIFLPNYFIFHHRDQWKRIVQEFDQLPKRNNRIGSWVVFGIVILIISNLIFSFWLLFDTPKGHIRNFF